MRSVIDVSVDSQEQSALLALIVIVARWVAAAAHLIYMNVERWIQRTQAPLHIIPLRWLTATKLR